MTESQIGTTISVCGFLIVLGIVLLRNYWNKIKSDPMTPYAIATGSLRSYNFKKHLTRKIEAGIYFRNFALKADKWNTCPCGNLPQCIPRGLDGTPIDNELFVLGDKFSEKALKLVELNGPELSSMQEEMLKVLRQIELRGNILARQEMAKHNELQITSNGKDKSN